MRLTYFGTRLSENISRREPEGYLICLNVPVARTGSQDYLPSELGLEGPDDRLIPVWRPEEEVFSPACVASFEGMPVTDDHPAAPDGVTAENIRYLQKGHAHQVRRGSGEDQDLLLADLIITDPTLIEEILAGKREISCGYTYALCEEDGRYIQREIRGNHVAVVDAGRAGPRVSIQDQEPDARISGAAPIRPGSPAFGGSPPAGGPGASGTPFTHSDTFERSNPMKKKSLWRAKMMARMAKDGDVEGLAEIITEMMEEPAVPADPALPAGDPVVSAVVNAVAENLDPETDEDPVVVETPVDQPVVVDCGPEILAALNQIITLLSGPVSGDACGEQEQDEDETAEALAEAVEEAAAEAAEALEILTPADEDPVEELVAEILESDEDGDEPEPLPEEEILSAILEPEDAGDEDPEDTEQAADALRIFVTRPDLRSRRCEGRNSPA